MLLKPENSTDTNELFECHGEYDVYQYNHGYGDVYKATIRISGHDRKAVWEQLDANTYKTQDLIFINRLVNELRIHIKMYLHGHHGFKKENK